jgi:hypothetical protein
MKRLLSILGILGIILCVAATGSPASSSSCTQKVEKTGDQAVLTIVSTAASDNSFAACALTGVNTTALKGYYITEVFTSPGGTAPTGGTAIALNTADSPVIDILGGVASCSATLTTRFVPKLNATATVYGGASVTGGLSLAITGNAVSVAVITTKVVLWKN